MTDQTAELKRLQIIVDRDGKYAEKIVANYYLNPEFRETIKAELDRIEDGEWVTLAIYRPIEEFDERE